MTHIPEEMRRQVREAANGRCAYCHSTEALMGVTFEVDHVIPLSAGGQTTPDNLCLSCPNCNRHKARRLTAPDPQTGEVVALYHPHHQTWNDHFAWSEDGSKVIGLTATGRATVVALQMNRPQIVQLRRYWAALELHPPQGE